MKDKDINQLLDLLNNTDDVKEKIAPKNDLISYIREKEIKPGKFKINIKVFLYGFSGKTNSKEIKESLNFLGFKMKKNEYVFISEEDRERLTLEYAKKISEKIYKE